MQKEGQHEGQQINVSLRSWSRSRLLPLGWATSRSLNRNSDNRLLARFDRTFTLPVRGRGREFDMRLCADGGNKIVVVVVDCVPVSRSMSLLELVGRSVGRSRLEVSKSDSTNLLTREVHCHCFSPCWSIASYYHCGCRTASTLVEISLFGGGQREREKERSRFSGERPATESKTASNTKFIRRKFRN